MLAVPAEHRLARGHGPVTEAELSGEPVVLLEEGHCLRAQALALCDAAGAREAGGIQATSLGTLVQMVANGLGITLLPATSLGGRGARGQRPRAARFRGAGAGSHDRSGLAARLGAPRRVPRPRRDLHPLRAVARALARGG